MRRGTYIPACNFHMEMRDCHSKEARGPKFGELSYLPRFLHVQQSQKNRTMFGVLFKMNGTLMCITLFAVISNRPCVRGLNWLKGVTWTWHPICESSKKIRLLVVINPVSYFAHPKVAIDQKQNPGWELWAVTDKPPLWAVRSLSLAWLPHILQFPQKWKWS